jgi:hypothetical protein
MEEDGDGAVVTEDMITEAAATGDLESLTIWANQGVRCTTAVPLCVAARFDNHEVLQFLVRKMGADVNQLMPNGGATVLLTAVILDDFDLGMVHFLVEQLGADINKATADDGTPLHVAARKDNLTIVRCLVQLGAEVGTVDNDGYTALLASILTGRFRITQFLLEEAGANMADVNNDGETMWDLLIVHLEKVARDDDVEHDFTPLTALLRVLVLRDAPLPALVALLPPEHARVVQEGARLRERLPAYLVRRRALLDAHCPMLLPPLRDLVHGYTQLITTEDLWATGLGADP